MDFSSFSFANLHQANLTWLFWQTSKLSPALSKLEKKGIEALDATSFFNLSLFAEKCF